MNLNDAELIDYWKLIKTNNAVAKNIDYLIALKTAYNSPRIDNHILKLDIYINPTTNGVVINGGHSLSNMLSALPPGYRIELEKCKTFIERI